jgi:type II secretory pathway component PulM
MATALQPATRDGLRQWWQLRTPTERTVFAALAAIVVAAVAWLVVWQPMQRDVERMARELSVGRAALAEARRRADDIAALARNSAAPAPRETKSDLDAALARAGVKPIAIDRVDNDRLRVVIDNIGFDALVGLLDALQRDARLRAVDLTVTGRVEPGQVRAEMTLAP